MKGFSLPRSMSTATTARAPSSALCTRCSDHVEALAVDFLLTVVEMELHQFIGLAGQRDGAVANTDLQRVAIVDNVEVGRTIGEFDRFEVDLDPFLDVDR